MTETPRSPFPEREFQVIAPRLVGTRSEFDQNGDRIDAQDPSLVGWSVNVQRMKDCRKGAMWAWDAANESPGHHLNMIQRLVAVKEELLAENKRLREALESIKAKGDLCIYSENELYRDGSHDAFGECAGIAADALKANNG